jgi:competence protein ComEC
MKPARAIICIIATGIFLLIVPPRAPTLRAAIICWVFCASFLFHRKSNSLNTLSLAAIILLLIRPTYLFEAGWQLSFAAVLGIILFAGRIEGFLYEKVTDSFWSGKILKTKLFFRVPPALGSHLLKLFSIGLAAWLGSVGILLYHFYTINPLTSIWTVIAFPFVALLLTVGYLKIILSLLLPTVAALLGVIVTALAAALIWIVEHIAALGLSQILIGHVPFVPIALYYCFILFAGAPSRWPLIKRAACSAAVVIIIASLGITKWQRTHRDNLVLTCLDVGHGQAIFAQLPSSANILFDAGSLYKSNIGQRVVAPFLDYIGTNKIDAIIISHNNVDHINGIPEIVESYDVNDIYANNAFFRHPDPWGTAGTLKSLVKIHRLGKNVNVESSAKIKILWPSEQICQDKTLSNNDKSLVSLIEFAGTKILLCSDIEKFAQKELLRIFPNLRPDIIVVPHHGSARTMDAEFLKTLDPNILICSCSRSHYEKHQVIKPLNSAKSLYTAKDGAVTVRIDKESTLQVETFIRQK